MRNDHEFRKAIRSCFSDEAVPPEIHHRILETCRTLEISQKETVSIGGKFIWKKLAICAASVATVFLMLCGVNTVNPALAESIPLIGEAFRMYNDGKVRVGTYIGTYGDVEQVGSLAAATNTEGLSLTLKEAYCDGEYVHLAFSMEGTPQKLMKKLSFMSAEVTAFAEGASLEKTSITFYPESERLVGIVSLPLSGTNEMGEVIDLDYHFTDLIWYYNDGADWELLSGSFDGQISVLVDASHNQNKLQFVQSGVIRVDGVEITPSFTKIRYTIPFWGVSTYTVNFPRLYLTDGTELSLNPSLSQLPGPEEIDRDAQTISGVACFDGLPSGTEKVILRFLEKDLDSYTATDMLAHGMEVRVLAEATIDLAAGMVIPSTTYLDEGMTLAENYCEEFDAIRWMMPFDDPGLIACGQASWNEIAAIPGLFQHGNSLWLLGFDDAFTVEFVTDGSVPENDLNVTIRNEEGVSVASGVLLAESAEKTQDGQATYYSWKTEMQPIEHYVPRLLDTLTVELSEPNSGKLLYQRSVRLVQKQ